MCAVDDVTDLLNRMTAGDKDAEAKLVPVVYRELHRLALIHLRKERPGHTLQATELVNEIYLKLAHNNSDWKNRAHFFRVAAMNMRSILVDYARKRNARKRSGIRVTLDEALFISDQQCDLVDKLDDALQRLATLRSRQAKVVEMRFFAGLTQEEIAEVLGVDIRTVKRDWEKAQAFLYGELSDREPAG